MIILKTEAGQQAFKARSPLLSARQRSAFILFDGVKSAAQVLIATAGLGISQEDIDHLIQQGFLVAAPGGAPVSAGPKVRAVELVASPSQEVIPKPVESLSSRMTIQERYSQAMPIATKLTASLGLRGFRLNLAVEGASGYADLLALLPKIKEAVGKPCSTLEQVLLG